MNDFPIFKAGTVFNELGGIRKKSKLIFVTKNAKEMIESSKIVIEKLGFASISCDKTD